MKKLFACIVKHAEAEEEERKAVEAAKAAAATKAVKVFCIRVSLSAGSRRAR